MGHLRQARSRIGAGGRGAADGGSELRARPVSDRHRRARLRRSVVRSALSLPGSVRRRARSLPPGAIGRRRRVLARQLPDLRPHAPERLRGRRLQPRLQDDRRGPRDRPRAAGRALHAAAPVPLRALRHRRPASGVEQPVPLELMSASHVVVGAGVNGLSAAWRLAERGADVLVLDKGRVGGGASGIAGGIVRNYYPAEGITEGVRLSVEVFESDPDAYGFRQAGYLAAVPERQVDDLVAIREQHERAGYDSELVVGAERCHEYLRWSWSDWEAPVAAILHERRGGWADAMQSVRHLAERARGAGVEIREAVEVVGIDGRGVVTREGRIDCETVLVALGPWIPGVWRL